MSGATVVLVDSDEASITDEEGFYVLGPLRPRQASRFDPLRD